MVNTGFYGKFVLCKTEIILGLGFFHSHHKNHVGSLCSSLLISRDWERIWRSHFRRVIFTSAVARFGFAVRFLVLPWGFWFVESFLVLPWAFWFCREIIDFAVKFLLLPWNFCFCREGIWFCSEVFGFAVRLLVLPWHPWATVDRHLRRHCYKYEYFTLRNLPLPQIPQTLQKLAFWSTNEPHALQNIMSSRY